MKIYGWTLALAAAFAAPAAHAMTIDADERELYGTSIQCMTYFGILAGLGGDGAPTDAKAAETGTKFLTLATVLADDDREQIGRDFEAEMKRFGLLTADPNDPDKVAKVREIDERCRMYESVVDAAMAGAGD